MSIFTRRHYIWLASVGRDLKNQLGSNIESGKAIQILADALESESEGFNREEFMQNVYDRPRQKILTNN